LADLLFREAFDVLEPTVAQHPDDPSRLGGQTLFELGKTCSPRPLSQDLPYWAALGKTAKNACSGPSQAKVTLQVVWFYLSPNRTSLRCRTAVFGGRSEELNSRKAE
jgi:hypothetical protein